MKMPVEHLETGGARVLRSTPRGRVPIELAGVLLCGMTIVGLLGSAFGEPHAVAGAMLIFGGACGLVAYGVGIAYEAKTLGPGNAITALRLALVCALTTPFFVPGPMPDSLVWLAVAVAMTALALDGLDGYAARRSSLVSGFGARFDMEVDSGFALMLAVLAVDLGHAGLWVLALGLPRYAFFAAGIVWPWLQGALPDRLSRKAVCVLQIGVLILLLMPITPPGVGTALGLAVVAAVLWSFLRDILFLRDRAG